MRVSKRTYGGPPDFARSTKAPLALEAVQQIDAIFAVERDISGQAAGQRLAVRSERVVPLVEELKHWMAQ